MGDFHQPYFWAAMELWNAARTDDELRIELLAAERRLSRAFKHVIDTMYGPVHSSHPAFPNLRKLIFSSMRGVAMTYPLQRLDPASDPHLVIRQQVARAILLDER